MRAVALQKRKEGGTCDRRGKEEAGGSQKETDPKSKEAEKADLEA